MKTGPVAYGLLLVAALAFAYQTWTREKTVDPKTGDYVVWAHSVDSFESLLYDSEQKSVRIERRSDDHGQYLWGEVKRSRKVPKKPKPKKTPGADAGADSSTPPEPEPPPEDEIITTTREFPIGEIGKKVLESFSTLRALRELGVIDEDRKEEYGLSESKDNLTVFFKGGTSRSLIVGKRVFSGSDRYVMDPESSKAWVIATAIMRHIDGAESALSLKKLHLYEDKEVAKVTVKTNNGDKTLIKGEEANPKGKGKKITWADSATPDESDLMLANFLSRAGKLKAIEYDPKLDATSLDKAVSFHYMDASGAEIGYLEVYRKMPDLDAKPEPGKSLRKPVIEYYIRTELTRVLGKVGRLNAERVDQDLADLFGVEVPKLPTPPAVPKPTPTDKEATTPGGPGPHGEKTPALPGNIVPGKTKSATAKKATDKKAPAKKTP